MTIKELEEKITTMWIEYVKEHWKNFPIESLDEKDLLAIYILMELKEKKSLTNSRETLYNKIRKRGKENDKKRRNADKSY